MGKDLYISVDVETDGPIPGPNSMLSLGAAAFVLNPVGGKEPDEYTHLADFSVNLDTLEGATPNADTMRWWATQKEAWDECRKNTVHPAVGMKKFHDWIEQIAAPNGLRPVFVGYPAGFDFLFVYWYLMNFVGHSPFSFSALDIKSYAMAMLKTEYRHTTKKNFPGRWFKGQPPHNHVALQDAIGQGILFMNMLLENRG
jgi:hypothetical protein